MNAGAGYVCTTASGPSSGTSSTHRRINALRMVCQRSSLTRHAVVYELAYSLTTSVSCRARLMVSAANVIPTASGEAHIECSTTTKRRTLVTFQAHFLNALVYIECIEEANYDKFQLM